MKKVIKMEDNLLLVNNIVIKRFRSVSYDTMLQQIIESIVKHQENFSPKEIYNNIYGLENYDYVYVVICQLNKATEKVFGVPLFLKYGFNRVINPILQKKKMIKVSLNLPVGKYEKFLNEYKNYIIKENK